MTSITKYYGPPGTGKTRTLKRLVAEEITTNGVQTNEIAFMAFTRKEAKNGAKRIGELGINTKELTWFRTIHSTCYKLLDLKEGMVITEDLREEFFIEYNIGYVKQKAGTSVNALDDLSALFDLAAAKSFNIGYGNIILLIIEWCYQNYPLLSNPLMKYANCPIMQADNLNKLRKRNIIPSGTIAYSLIESIHYAYKDYKNNNNYYDFLDMLTETLANDFSPPVKVLIIDEAQDLNPLQWALVDNWIDYPMVERVYLAGDYNQAIYGFAGANPQLLLQHIGETVFIAITHRLRKNILDYSKKIIQDPRLKQLHTCKDPNCSCNSVGRGDGHVYEIGSTSLFRQLYNNTINGIDCFALFRTNALLTKFTYELIKNGIPFKQVFGQSVWTSKYSKTGTNLIALNNIMFRLMQPKEQWSFSFNEFGEIVKHLKKSANLLMGLKTNLFNFNNNPAFQKKFNKPNDTINFARILQNQPVTWQTLFNCFKTADDARQVLNGKHIIKYFRLGTLQQQCLDYSLGYIEHKKVKLTLSTIHKAKGQEAAEVFLFSEVNKLIADSCNTNHLAAAEEQRVFYVGCTRPKERLFIIKDYFHTGYQFFMPTAEEFVYSDPIINKTIADPLDIIRNVFEEYADDNGLSYDILAAKTGFPNEKLEQMLMALQLEGEIMESFEGIYKMIY